MENITFGERDAAITFSMPAVEVDLAGIIRYYMFFNRDAPPPFDVLRQLLEKAVKTGILRMCTVGKFQVDPAWFRRMHEHDNDYKNEMEALERWEENLCSRPWPQVTELSFVLSAGDYATAIQKDLHSGPMK